MIKREQVYEGKAKKVYKTDDPELLIVSYKDDATAFNGLKKGTISGKGVINNRMSNFFMKTLEERGISRYMPLTFCQKAEGAARPALTVAIQQKHFRIWEEIDLKDIFQISKSKR